MPSQRVRAGGSRTERRLLNGPLRAQGKTGKGPEGPKRKARGRGWKQPKRKAKGKGRKQPKGVVSENRQVFCDVRHTSVAGNMLVFHKGTERSVKQGGTAGIKFAELVLDSRERLSGAFFICADSGRCVPTAYISQTEAAESDQRTQYMRHIFSQTEAAENDQCTHCMRHIFSQIRAAKQPSARKMKNVPDPAQKRRNITCIHHQKRPNR